MSGDEVGEGGGLASLLRRTLAVVSDPAFQGDQRIGLVCRDLFGDRSRIVIDARNESDP